MTIASLYPVLCSGLLLFLACPTARLSAGRRYMLLIAALLLAAAPVSGFSISVALRGLVGDLSVFTLFWLCCSTAERLMPGCTPLGSASPHSQRRFAAALIVLGAVILYPAALGLGGWDSYRLGYGVGLLGATLGVAILSYYRRQTFTLLALTACLASYAVLLLESTNLWDYLIDPALAIYALAILLRRPHQ